MHRRDFLAAAGALGLAGAHLAPPGAQAAAAELKIKKALVFGMLKGDAPLLDRFKMARAAGFEGVEAYTTSEPAGVAELKRASQESGLVRVQPNEPAARQLGGAHRLAAHQVVRRVRRQGNPRQVL